MITAAGARGVPLLLPRDSPEAADAFLTREAKFARRWLYGKGIMLPEEDYNPVDAELRAFFECCKDPLHKRPKADLTAGLNDSTAVILSNLAMDEGRRVYFTEMEQMGRGDHKVTATPKPATAG
jgi:hypothetical protein